MKILVIDVGGTNIKVSMTGCKSALKIPSGPDMTAAQMIAAVRRATTGWKYDRVTVGYPGPVVKGRPAAEPRNLGTGWRRMNFAGALGKRVRVVNDAAMQALGCYRGGRMLFLGLGTGLGSALVVDGELAPLELAHLPYRNGKTYEQYIGRRGRQRLGLRRWRKHVNRIVELLADAFQADDVVLGGGETKHLKKLPPRTRKVENDNAILGGLRLWVDPKHRV
jgi:polyphosphate glucokinase